MEIMLAFSLMIFFTISTFTLTSSVQELKVWSLKELEKLKIAVRSADEFEGSTEFEYYGNDTKQFLIDPFVLNYSDYAEAWGRNSCYPRLKFDVDKAIYFPVGVNIGSGNTSTDIEARNGIVYLTADSTSSSQKDFFIIDTNEPTSPNIISSINTGPGLSALEVAGPYIFAAQASSVNQLQVVDIYNRNSPQLISQLKLPLPTPTTTAPFATSIFYSRGYVYLGTEKWNGPEFAIIDVSNVYDPQVVGTFEANTLVSDIYVRDSAAYLATADSMQMRLLDISQPTDPFLISSFSPTGWQTQTGKSLEYFEGQLGFGRTVGGFNVPANHEAFVFHEDDLQASKDVPGGVYGMLIRPENIFLLTHKEGEEFQIWDRLLTEKIQNIPLEVKPPKMSCDGSSIFFATGDAGGLTQLKLNE